ncbi:MAG: TfoX/Sxy family protein [Rhodobacteraceae bacterium]|jgi:hypothetical protein|nr:TfoX/Sxy family protein [Paracoccaceae bacterium]
MAHDDTLARLLRADLAGIETVEKKMFGGLAFLHRGHMLCGLHKGGGMFRVGKERLAEALRVPGAAQMTMGVRLMGGMADATPELLADDTRRGTLLRLALAFNREQPPK